MAELLSEAELSPDAGVSGLSISNRRVEWTGDYLEVRLWDAKGGLLASESLYEED